MTLLASIPSNLGRISLHHTKDGFSTRRTYRDCLTHEERTVSIPLGPDQAEEWYLMCLHRGLVKRPFPEVTP